MGRNFNPSAIILQKMKSYIPFMRYKYGEDFSKWQKDARIKLNELLGLPFEKCDFMLNVEYDKNNGDFKETRFTFQSEEGYFIPCHLLIPNGVKTPVPTFICVQGHSTGMHISLGRTKFEGDERVLNDGDRNYAIRAVKEGYGALVMEQRYMGECGGNGKETGCASLWTALPSLLMGRCAVGERVWDIQRAIDVLSKNFPRVDSNNIMCMGNSGGGTATFYASCIDERIKLSMPSCSVCTYRDSIAAMQHCCCNYVPHIAEFFDMGDIGGLIAPRKLVIVAGEKDPIFPINGVKESFDIIKDLYHAAYADENVTLVIGEEGHRFYADMGYKAVKELLELG